MATFPSKEWLYELKEKLNKDEKYAQVAHKWEGDMLCLIEPGGELKTPLAYYLDLWHGQCRDAFEAEDPVKLKPVLLLSGTFENYCKLLKGELDPMQALMTRRLSVKGSMAILMRNVPTVLEFVRCAREITTSFSTGD